MERRLPAERPGGDGFDVILDTVGGATLDPAFESVRLHTGRAVSILGWGLHDLAPLSFRVASYCGVFTLPPLLTGHGREHHGDRPETDHGRRRRRPPDPDRRSSAFTLDMLSPRTARSRTAQREGEIVVDVH